MSDMATYTLRSDKDQIKIWSRPDQDEGFGEEFDQDLLKINVKCVCIKLHLIQINFIKLNMLSLPSHPYRSKCFPIVGLLYH